MNFIFQGICVCVTVGGGRTLGDGLQLGRALRVGRVQRLGLLQALQQQEGVVVLATEVRQVDGEVAGVAEALRPVHTPMQNLHTHTERRDLALHKTAFQGLNTTTETALKIKGPLLPD